MDEKKTFSCGLSWHGDCCGLLIVLERKEECVFMDSERNGKAGVDDLKL